MIKEFYLLESIKELRNAAAHNNCIINDLNPKTSKKTTKLEVSKALGDMKISKDIHGRKMSNARIQQIITMLYCHKKFVTSQGTHQHQSEALASIIARMFKNIDYYSTNDTINTTFDFLKKVVDNWFHYHYNGIT
ncbi:MAG: hypothetical protein ACYCYI_01600 [Saccharofermentanales bacterium]